MTKPEIYVSYAWRDREKDPAPDDRETLVEQFCAACEKRRPAGGDALLVA